MKVDANAHPLPEGYSVRAVLLHPRSVRASLRIELVRGRFFKRRVAFREATPTDRRPNEWSTSKLLASDDRDERLNGAIAVTLTQAIDLLQRDLAYEARKHRAMLDSLSNVGINIKNLRKL
ncbi:hypothetical protein GS982_01725 [Rhodococcus hoagii]|uniref:Uncharacterized protein n=1 Tax=Rhodococcus hoagii TaxID=43767 RepID=A0A9Q4ZIT1_RHOHA|nr:hypothetical protein [Prescottella equi]NKT77317.1 hypothetical protein [Prescottella equi]NKZ81104.1 hypothetical protein [Prescottella equi]